MNYKLSNNYKSKMIKTEIESRFVLNKKDNNKKITYIYCIFSLILICNCIYS